tara:strand:+ start:396 stop:881 length:486 start_codon:yes stop_codon:yes gene_type:complete
MDRLPNVKNVNKGKRHKKKHQFKIGTPVVFKWYGERDYGHISALTFDKGTKNAHYSIKATGRMGCVYHTLELDDPDDPYCYVSSVLTKSIPDTELQKISDHKLGKHLITVVKPTVTKKVVKKKTVKKVAKPKKESVNKLELKKAINKQKDFLNGEIDKNFW